MNELKNCPFCNSDQVKLTTNSTIKYGGASFCFVKCLRCKAQGPLVTNKNGDIKQSEELGEKLWGYKNGQ